MCVPSNVRSRWLSEYSDKALRLLNAIEAISVEGCTEPISKADLMKVAGIKHRQSMTRALDEVVDDIAIMTISARKASYSLRCLLERGTRGAIAMQEGSQDERYASTTFSFASVHQVTISGSGGKTQATHD